MTTNKGIDYSGLDATCNRDATTGIRFGIIPANDLPYWWDSSEPDYGEACCPDCGGGVDEYNEDDHGEFEQEPCSEYACEKCEKGWANESVWPDECLGNVLDDGEYKAFSDDSGDVWFTLSPYYTRAKFCSPCAPGACYLTRECPDGEKAYCPGHDWFDGGKAPYRVFSVSDDSEVFPDSKA